MASEKSWPFENEGVFSAELNKSAHSTAHDQSCGFYPGSLGALHYMVISAEKQIFSPTPASWERGHTALGTDSLHKYLPLSFSPPTWVGVQMLGWYVTIRICHGGPQWPDDPSRSSRWPGIFLLGGSWKENLREWLKNVARMVHSEEHCEIQPDSKGSLCLFVCLSTLTLDCIHSFNTVLVTTFHRLTLVSVPVHSFIHHFFKPSVYHALLQALETH